MLQRRVGIVLMMVAVATVTGPFDTFNTMAFWDRLAYWGFALSGISLVVAGTISAFLKSDIFSFGPIIRMAIGAVVAAVFAGALLMLLDHLVKGAPVNFEEYFSRFMNIAVIGFGIGLAELYLSQGFSFGRDLTSEAGSVPAHDEVVEAEAVDVTPVVAPAPKPKRRAITKAEPPLFLRGVDPALGHELVSVSVNDHYLDVVTRAGSEQILKRMSDAMAELEGYPGVRIHRSHWVALDAIAEVQRDGRKCAVVLVDGRELPVSRPNVGPLTALMSEIA